MARYECAFVTPAAATNAALFDIRTSASRLIRVLEIGLMSTAATTVTPSLERSTTLGTTSTTVVPQAINPAGPAATSVVGTAWSGAPASTSVPFRRVALPANIGAGFIWTFGDGGILIPVSSSLVIMNRLGTTGPVMNGYIVIDE